MITRINRAIPTKLRLAATLMVCFTLAATPAWVAARDKDALEDQTELRIKEMHTKLKITPEQEAQWAKVTQVMLENAKKMDALTQTRFDHAKEMTAIDDLKSYGEIAEAHAEGIKQLTGVFAELYDGMPDAQKKQADIFFREGSPQPKQLKKAKKTGAQ